MFANLVKAAHFVAYTVLHYTLANMYNLYIMCKYWDCVFYEALNSGLYMACTLHGCMWQRLANNLP